MPPEDPEQSPSKLPEHIQAIAQNWEVEINPQHPLALQLGLTSYAIPRPITEEDSARYRQIVGLMGQMAMNRFVNKLVTDSPEQLEQTQILALGTLLRGAVAEINQENITYLRQLLNLKGLSHITIATFGLGIKRDPFGNPTCYFDHYPEAMLQTPPETILVYAPDTGGATGQTFQACTQITSEQLGIPLSNFYLDCMFCTDEAINRLSETAPQAHLSAFLRGALDPQTNYLDRIGLADWPDEQLVKVVALDWGEATVGQETPGDPRTLVINQTQIHLQEVGTLLGTPADKMRALSNYHYRKYPVMPGPDIDPTQPVLTRSFNGQETIYSVDLKLHSPKEAIQLLNSPNGIIHLKPINHNQALEPTDISTIVYANGWELLQPTNQP